MDIIEQQGAVHGYRSTCRALGVAPSTYYRRKATPYGPKQKKPSPPRRIPQARREEIWRALNEPRFVDLSPAEVHAALLDEGVYLCSLRTMHRIVAERIEPRERRNQLKHPTYDRPQLLAKGPHELWSWDITKLKGPQKWNYFYLYVILDVFSRYVVGWMIADRESATLAQKLIKETIERQGVPSGQLTLHADRGSSMKSKCVAFLLADLGVTKTHSRPHVSDDNPYSESHFKTLKYRPDFPGNFGCIEDARSFCRDFFDWYNEEHHHVGLELLTPSDVHHGRAAERVAQRQQVLDKAYRDHPERFPNGPPRARAPEPIAWINKPEPGAADAGETPASSRDALGVTGDQSDENFAA